MHRPWRWCCSFQHRLACLWCVLFCYCQHQLPRAWCTSAPQHHLHMTTCKRLLCCLPCNPLLLASVILPCCCRLVPPTSCLSLKSWTPCTIASWCDAPSARSPAPSWAAWLAWQPARGPPTPGLALLGSPAAMVRQQWRRLRGLLGWTLKTSGGP